MIYLLLVISLLPLMSLFVCSRKKNTIDAANDSKTPFNGQANPNESATNLTTLAKGTRTQDTDLNSKLALFSTANNPGGSMDKVAKTIVKTKVSEDTDLRSFGDDGGPARHKKQSKKQGAASNYQQTALPQPPVSMFADPNQPIQAKIVHRPSKVANTDRDKSKVVPSTARKQATDRDAKVVNQSVVNKSVFVAPPEPILVNDKTQSSKSEKEPKKPVVSNAVMLGTEQRTQEEDETSNRKSEATAKQNESKQKEEAVAKQNESKQKSEAAVKKPSQDEKQNESKFSAIDSTQKIGKSEKKDDSLEKRSVFF